MKEQEEKVRREEELREEREGEREERARKLDAEIRRVAEIETLRMQLEQMKKDRDAVEQKNAEQLAKIRKNCQDHDDDDETTRSKLSVHFETTTSEVILQEQQLSVQDEQMNEEKEKEEAENAEKAKEEESCLEKAREKEKEEARAQEA